MVCHTLPDAAVVLSQESRLAATRKDCSMRTALACPPLWAQDEHLQGSAMLPCSSRWGCFRESRSKGAVMDAMSQRPWARIDSEVELILEFLDFGCQLSRETQLLCYTHGAGAGAAAVVKTDLHRHKAAMDKPGVAKSSHKDGSGVRMENQTQRGCGGQADLRSNFLRTVGGCRNPRADPPYQVVGQTDRSSRVVAKDVHCQDMSFPPDRLSKLLAVRAASARCCTRSLWTAWLRCGTGHKPSQ